jgi:hypothetical protein
MSARDLSRSVFVTTPSRLSLIMSRSFWKFVNSIVKSELLSIETSILGLLGVFFLKTDLDKSLADIVKKSDLETVVTSIVTKLLDSFKKEINDKISEKSNKQTKAIENLTKENEELREQFHFRID